MMAPRTAPSLPLILSAALWFGAALGRGIDAPAADASAPVQSATLPSFFTNTMPFAVLVRPPQTSPGRSTRSPLAVPLASVGF